MYAYIKGILEEVSEDVIVVENGGIGYNIRIYPQLIDSLPAIGSEVKIFTYLNVKEDVFNLFGFASKDELELFKMLITVNGVGPKGALGILSVLSPSDLRYAILAGDSKTISKSPGIGAKTAQKIVIELKDKIDIEIPMGGETETVSVASNIKNAAKKEAIEALTALGYSSSEATKAVNTAGIEEDDDTETILKKALKNMAFM